MSDSDVGLGAPSGGSGGLSDADVGLDPNKDYSLGEALEGAKQNFGTSWANQLGNMGNAIMHPQETLENMGRTGLGEYDLALGQTGQNADMARAMNKHFQDETTWKGFKKEMATDPATLMTDAGMFADPAIGGLAKAGVIGDRTAMLARAATNPVYGAGKAIGAIAPKAGRFGASLAGVVSGTGGDPLENYFNAAEQGGNRLKVMDEANKGERGADSSENIVKDTRDALSQFNNATSMAYDEDAKNVPWNTPMPNAGKKILASFQQAAQDFGINPKFNMAKDPMSYQALKDMGDVILDWGKGLNTPAPTIGDLDFLKQRLWNEGKKYRTATNANPAAALVTKKMSAAVRDSIDSPEYDTLTQNWQANKEMGEQMERTLSLGDKKTIDESFRKLLSTQRDAINTGYGQRKSLMGVLDTISPGLSDRISGMTLSSLVPRGVSRLGTVGAVLGWLGHGGLLGAGLGGLGAAGLDLLATSPKIQGKIARTMGRAAPDVRAGWGATVANPITTRAVQQAGNRFSPGAVPPSPFEQNNQ